MTKGIAMILDSDKSFLGGYSMFTGILLFVLALGGRRGFFKADLNHYMDGTASDYYKWYPNTDNVDKTYYAKTDGEFVMEMTTKKSETYQMDQINDGNEHIFVLKPSSMSLSNGLPSLAKKGYKEID
ncbi:hypothetical protein E3P78_01104 [Wallemia ichthyophaga]|nr:hypothetical protein E3P78_01104 [Wallemia ichthyophaga]